MWILVAFDVPSLTSDERKQYRILKKQLVGFGFMSWQKSLFVRWVDSFRKKNTILSGIKKYLPVCSKILILTIPDSIFEKAILFQGQQQIELPQKPGMFQFF